MKYILLWSVLLTALIAQAQIFEAVPSESVTIRLTPEFPKPLSPVRARLVSFTVDLDRARIEWFLDGRVLAEGVGVKEVRFEAGPAGSGSELTVFVSPQGGGEIQTTLELRPQEIDLLAESSSFRPPWYKGASLITPGARVRVSALPHFTSAGARLRPETLIYNWRIDDEVRGDLSGRGKASVIFPAGRVAGERTEVFVKISSADGAIESEARTFVEAQSPELLFYARKPLEGTISSEALREKTIPAGTDLEVEAVPLFLNFASLSDLEFGWNFDGEVVPADPAEPNLFLVKSTAGTKGGALLGLSVQNLKNIIEAVSSSLQIYVE